MIMWAPYLLSVYKHRLSLLKWVPLNSIQATDILLLQVLFTNRQLFESPGFSRLNWVLSSDAKLLLYLSWPPLGSAGAQCQLHKGHRVAAQAPANHTELTPSWQSYWRGRFSKQWKNSHNLELHGIICGDTKKNGRARFIQIPWLPSALFHMSCKSNSAYVWHSRSTTQNVHYHNILTIDKLRF